jgi:small GTP-binding protein
LETETSASLRRILIADNDEHIVEEIARELRRRSTFEIHTFTTGQAAREALQGMPFDLLIVDSQIADVDGPTLIREAQERSQDTITVLMTTIGAPEIKSIPGNSTAHHYLEKPFAVAELINVIDSIFLPVPPHALRDTPLVLKVVLGGDANVGKTSLIQRYCTGAFDPVRAMTIGVDFHLYNIQIEGMPVRLVVWDLGGQGRFGFARRAFYRGTRAVALIFDASNRASFYNLMRWWREARDYLQDAPVLLLANKTDLPRQISSTEALQIAQAWNMPFFESSCATGAGVKEFFEALALYAWKHTFKKPPN